MTVSFKTNYTDVANSYPASFGKRGLNPEEKKFALGNMAMLSLPDSPWYYGGNPFYNGEIDGGNVGLHPKYNENGELYTVRAIGIF